MMRGILDEWMQSTCRKELHIVPGIALIMFSFKLMLAGFIVAIPFAVIARFIGIAAGWVK